MLSLLQDVNTPEDLMLLIQHIESYDNYRNNLSSTKFTPEQSLFYEVINVEVVSKFFQSLPSGDQQMQFLKLTQKRGSPEAIKQAEDFFDYKLPLRVTIPIYDSIQRERGLGVTNDQQLRSMIAYSAEKAFNVFETLEKKIDLRKTTPGTIIYMEASDMKSLLSNVKSATDFILLAQHMASYDNYKNNLSSAELSPEQSLFHEVIDIEAVSKFFQLQPALKQQTAFLELVQKWSSPEVIQKNSELHEQSMVQEANAKVEKPPSYSTSAGYM